jgi:translin
MGEGGLSALAEVVERARAILEEEDEAREKLLKLTREVTRLCRKAVFRMHEGDLSGARELLASAGELVREILAFKASHPRLYHGGSVASALAEYVEASVLLAYLEGGRAPSFEDLRVEPEHYLLGIADFAGELRRLLVRSLSAGKPLEAERALKLMEEVYRALATIAVPEALVPGLRHKVDVLRALVESSARDILYYEVSSELEKLMREALAERGAAEGAV